MLEERKVLRYVEQRDFTENKSQNLTETDIDKKGQGKGNLYFVHSFVLIDK